MKRRWRIRVPVERASGEQVYEVEAATAEAARALYDRGDCGECVCEELQVETVGEPEIEEITED